MGAAEPKPPAVATVSLETLRAAHELLDPALHPPERREHVEQIRADYAHLIDQAKWSAEPL